jgi:hypothetical protein
MVWALPPERNWVGEAFRFFDLFPAHFSFLLLRSRERVRVALRPLRRRLLHGMEAAARGGLAIGRAFFKKKVGRRRVRVLENGRRGSLELW